MEGYYVTGNASGEPSPFARLQDLYDNGDGTFTAVIWKYYGGDIDPEEIASIQPTLDADGSYTATFIWYDSDGTSRMWSDSVNLRAEYKATIKPIGEGSSKRYILLEYIKTREFS